jgi:hypothetical protein
VIPNPDKGGVCPLQGQVFSGNRVVVRQAALTPLALFSPPPLPGEGGGVWYKELTRTWYDTPTGIATP